MEGGRDFKTPKRFTHQANACMVPLLFYHGFYSPPSLPSLMFGSIYLTGKSFPEFVQLFYSNLMIAVGMNDEFI